MEERVAELEAVTARKGNRKVTLTISGEVSKALLWFDGLDGIQGNKKLRVIDNPNAGTKIRLTGEGKISPTMKAGFIFEYGFDETRGLALSPLNQLIEPTAELRRSAVWVSTAVGKVTVGKFSVATDMITEIDTSESGLASRMMSAEPLWTYIGLGGLPIVGGNLLNPAPFHDLRAEVIRYDSPTLAGFTLAASWGNGVTASGDNMWDVALRYTTEFSGLKIAAGAGYRVEKYSTGGFVTLPGAPDQKTFSGSASVMHSATGLFLTGAYADQKDNPVFADLKMWEIRSGIERNWFGIGTTTLFAQYGEHEFVTMSSTSKIFGGGIVQNVDAGGLSLFGDVKKIEGDLLNSTVILGGMRIKF